MRSQIISVYGKTCRFTLYGGATTSEPTRTWGEPLVVLAYVGGVSNRGYLLCGLWGNSALVALVGLREQRAMRCLILFVWRVEGLYW